MSTELVSTKLLAKLLGISVASVNYYTNLGLFRIKDKSGNNRLYDKAEIFSVFENIRRLRKEGYSLRLIQQKITRGQNI